LPTPQASYPGQGDPDDPKRGLKLQTFARMWPTPRSIDGRSATGNTTDKALLNRNGRENLAERMQMLERWPTPSSRDWKDSPGMARTGTNPDGSQRTRTDQLARAVYATPRSEDSQCAGRRHNRNSSDTLYSQIVTDSGAPPGSLNPTWVEWLMGYPLGWTVLSASAMPLSRRSRK
jgi:hypothetical protein